MSRSAGSQSYDEAFVERLRQQDVAAFEKLFDEMADLVFARCVAILGDQTAAEDATQEIFLKAYRFLPGLKPGGVKSWLMTIARNHCFDEIRRKKRRPSCVNRPVEELKIRTAEKDAGESPDFMSLLPDEIRIPLMFKVVEELNYKEISQILDKTEGSLRNLVCKGMKILRKELDANDL
mgnify:CR=1 FL=1